MQKHKHTYCDLNIFICAKFRIEAKLAEVLANQSKTSVAPNKSAFECKTTSSDATAEPLNAAGVDDQKSTTTPSIAAAATTLQVTLLMT